MSAEKYRDTRAEKLLQDSPCDEKMRAFRIIDLFSAEYFINAEEKRQLLKRFQSFLLPSRKNAFALHFRRMKGAIFPRFYLASRAR